MNCKNTHYIKYTGKDKYHFRRYRLSKYHPFLVIMVVEESIKDGKTYISGFNMTHSRKMFDKRPNEFIELLSNPNIKDDSESYLNVNLITAESSLFTKPIKSWHLSKNDEIVIDQIIKKKLKKNS